MSVTSSITEINNQIAKYTTAGVAAVQIVEQVAPKEASGHEKLAAAAQAFGVIFSASPNAGVAAVGNLTVGILNASVLVANIFGLFRKKDKAAAPPAASTLGFVPDVQR